MQKASADMSTKAPELHLSVLAITVQLMLTLSPIRLLLQPPCRHIRTLRRLHIRPRPRAQRGRLVKTLRQILRKMARETPHKTQERPIPWQTHCSERAAELPLFWQPFYQFFTELHCQSAVALLEQVFTYSVMLKQRIQSLHMAKVGAHIVYSIICFFRSDISWHLEYD